MKTNLLKLRRVLNATLFVLLLTVAGMMNALGQNLVATLQHGDNISVFYGANALVQANDVAESGDIITLSSGSFQGTDITKAITLRGAGCIMDTVTGINPTVVYYNMNLNVIDDINHLTIEGISFSRLYMLNLNSPKIIKCNIEEIYGYGGEEDRVQNASFIDCKINYFNSSSRFTNIQFYNSVLHIRDAVSENSFSFNNSIVSGDMPGILAQNSILLYCPNEESLCINCVIIPRYSWCGYDANNNDNMIVYSCSEIFETFNGFYYGSWGSISNFDFGERYNLKEEFASSFLGTDGNEVGIYGGLAPYNTRPNYMVLKQCNVANQSTVDGKLSIEIRVVAEGE